MPSDPMPLDLSNSPRILVTGGAGFIGSALIHALNEHGVESIVITDVLGSDEKWKNLVPLAFEDYLEAHDFRERFERSPDAFGRFNAVFHLGACSATTEKNAAYLATNNYGFTRDLCRWSLGREARFVYASSAATYGDGTLGMDDRMRDLQRLRPLNMYGYSKQMFDLHATRARLLDSIVGVKYFNVFGPNEYHKGDMRSVVCKAFDQISGSGCLRLFRSHRPDYHDGEQKRDFIYVRDAVDMTIHLACSGTSGLFNIGAGVARTWNDLAKAIFKAMELEPNIEYINMPENIRHQYQYHTCADISKLRDSGYTKEPTRLEAAVHDYVKHYLIPRKRLGE